MKTVSMVIAKEMGFSDWALAEIQQLKNRQALAKTRGDWMWLQAQIIEVVNVEKEALRK